MTQSKKIWEQWEELLIVGFNNCIYISPISNGSHCNGSIELKIFIIFIWSWLVQGDSKTVIPEELNTNLITTLKNDLLIMQIQLKMDPMQPYFLFCKLVTILADGIWGKRLFCDGDPLYHHIRLLALFRWTTYSTTQHRSSCKEMVIYI